MRVPVCLECGVLRFKTEVTDRLITLDMDHWSWYLTRVVFSFCFLRLPPPACCLVPRPINRLMRLCRIKLRLNVGLYG